MYKVPIITPTPNNVILPALEAVILAPPYLILFGFFVGAIPCGCPFFLQ
jgi:hypothetical protein